MSSSNSYNFATSRDGLILAAHQHIQVVGEGGTNTSAQITEAAILLNMIVKLRAADGMPAWALRRGYVLPFTGASSINTDSHVVTNYDTTTLSAAAALGATTLTVTSITGFTNGDQIGIALTNGDVDWTTINGIPAGTSIIITTGLTSAAASGNRIYGYTSSSERVQKPIRIIAADLLTVSSNASNPIEILSQSEYFELSNRTSEGSTVGIYYTIEPSALTTLETNGKIFVYPRFADGTTVIEFTYQRPFADFDATGDEPDFPQAFYLPLMLELAALLGPKFGVPRDVNRDNLNLAIMYRQEALSTVYPEGSLTLSPDDRG